MPSLSSAAELLGAGAVSHYAYSVPCTGGLDIGGGTNRCRCANNKCWRDKELWSQMAPDVSLSLSGFCSCAISLTRADLFLHGGTASHLCSFPQAQTQSSLEPVKRFLWKYTRSGPGSSALSSIVLISTRQCLEYTGSWQGCPYHFKAKRLIREVSLHACSHKVSVHPRYPP